MDKWGYSYLIELKTLWEKEKLLVMRNFSISHNVFKRCLLLMHQNEYLWNKELMLSTWLDKAKNLLCVNSLLYDKILDLSNLKAFAEGKINVT